MLTALLRDRTATNAPWEATVRWQIDDQDVIPVSVQLTRTDGQPVTARDWRGVAIEAVIDESRRRLTAETRLRIAAELAADPQPDDPTADEVAEMVTERVTRKRPGRPRTWDDDHLRRVAAVYMEAVRTNSRHPVVDVAKAFDTTGTATAKAWVASARKHGFIN